MLRRQGPMRGSHLSHGQSRAACPTTEQMERSRFCGLGGESKSWDILGLRGFSYKFGANETVPEMQIC